MNGAWEILIVSPDMERCRELRYILKLQGCDPMCAQDVEQALALMQEQTIGLVFCDYHVRNGNCRDFLRTVRALKSKARVVVISRQADWDQYLETMRLGAFDMISAPCHSTDVEWMLSRASREERNRLRLAISESAGRASRAASAD